MSVKELLNSDNQISKHFLGHGTSSSVLQIEHTFPSGIIPANSTNKGFNWETDNGFPFNVENSNAYTGSISGFFNYDGATNIRSGKVTFKIVKDGDSKFYEMSTGAIIVNNSDKLCYFSTSGPWFNSGGAIEKNELVKFLVAVEFDTNDDLTFNSGASFISMAYVNASIMPCKLIGVN
jgi:hypothetical protein